VIFEFKVKIMNKTYILLLTFILLIWSLYFFWNNLWFLFNENWIITVTMIFWSFIAWATAEWGWAVAFPVFTKILDIPWNDAKIFSIMIQSIWMSMAMFMIWIKKIKVLKNVIIFWSLGWFIWQALWLLFVFSWLQLKILFTILVLCLWIVLTISLFRDKMSVRTEIISNIKISLFFFVIWIVWWIMVSKIWMWIDMLVFILLTILYWINEKISTPTTICLMAINSIFGFILQLYIWSISTTVISYWLVAIPVVIIWAPLWAYLISKISQRSLIKILLWFIILDIFSTFYTITLTMEVSVLILQAVIILSIFFISVYLIHNKYSLIE
jgi:hypothetical protein